MQTAIIMDDEVREIERLRLELMQYKDVEVTGVYNSGQMALEHIVSLKPDLAFLDLDLTNGSGLMFFKKINAQSPKTKIVLINAKRTSAERAFEYGVFDYLLKPVEAVRLRKTMERVLGATGKIEPLGTR